jgi:multicomponent Na+:H+ antiporter subunit G
MAWNDWVTVLLMTVSGFFFLAGTVGLLRFPDLWSRLHALTKADNLGLGLLVLALFFQAGNVWEVFKLCFIWALALVAGSTACYAIGHFHLTHGKSGADLKKGPGGEA